MSAARLALILIKGSRGTEISEIFDVTGAL
jgi:hypothetical protein